jgi:hypothetical protein
LKSLLVSSSAAVPQLRAAIGVGINVAVAATADDIVTVQVGVVPEHAPDQPLKVEPLAAAAVNVTDVPDAKLAEHDAVQLMPAGFDVTVPLPLPAIVRLSVCDVGAATNAAVADCAADIVTVHVEVLPVHAPDQPLNSCPAAGVAVSVTAVLTA